MAEAVDAATALARIASERDFQAAVVQYARLTGWLVFHAWSSRHSEAGFPDLVLVPERHAGPIIFAELKRETGRVRVAQSVWLRALQAVAARCPGLLVCVWKPSMWNEIEAILRGDPPGKDRTL